jgi:ribose transport system substrate-binding protein
MNRSLIAACCLLAVAGGGCNRPPAAQKIAVIPKSTYHTFWQSVHAGALKGSNEVGIAIDWNGPASETDTQEQIRLLSDMLAKGPGAVVIAPQDAKALVEPIKQAHKRMPVIVMDSAVATDDYTAFIATDNREGGRMAGREMIKLLGDKGGKVALLRNDPGSASTMDREAGFMEAIKGTKVEVAAEQFHHSDVQTANRQALDILLSHPDLIGIFASNEPGTIGAINALKADQNKDRHVQCVGFDSTDVIAEALDRGIIRALILQDPFRMGELSVKAAAAAMRGEQVKKEQPIPPTLVTQENKSEKAIQALLRPAVDTGAK